MGLRIFSPGPIRETFTSTGGAPVFKKVINQPAGGSPIHLGANFSFHLTYFNQDTTNTITIEVSDDQGHTFPYPISPGGCDIIKKCYGSQILVKGLTTSIYSLVASWPGEMEPGALKAISVTSVYVTGGTVDNNQVAIASSSTNPTAYEFGSIANDTTTSIYANPSDSGVRVKLEGGYIVTAGAANQVCVFIGASPPGQRNIANFKDTSASGSTIFFGQTAGIPVGSSNYAAFAGAVNGYVQFTTELWIYPGETLQAYIDGTTGSYSFKFWAEPL